ncbi:MAG TPA: hypothetical protein VEC16_06135 [Alphaproteobacteria bacterium]|nr:hypothetical protein [Alphaproteobacteria bacterium]
MSKEFEEQQEENALEELEQNPETLRDDDEITDAEEAFMEGYDSELEEEEEEEKADDEFDI